MSLKQQVMGLNDFLTDVYRQPTRVSEALSNLGLNTMQLVTLQQESLTLFVQELVETIARRTLSWSNGAITRIILVRGFGLDGQPPLSVEALGRELNMPASRVADLALKTLNQWRRKATRTLLEESMRQIALGLVENRDYGRDAENIRYRLTALQQRRQAQRALLQELQARRDEIMAPIKPALAALESQARPALDAVADEIRELSTAICEEVLTLGASVYSDALTAEYHDGRASWDDEALLGYAAQHPEILQYRRVSQPTVTLREYPADDQRAAPVH